MLNPAHEIPDSPSSGRTLAVIRRRRATSTSGHGRFERVTYIQRVNTIGGTAPADAGLIVGDEARVPYTAEYYFYRASKR